jgi:hypothetical protein
MYGFKFLQLAQVSIFFKALAIKPFSENTVLV